MLSSKKRPLIVRAAASTLSLSAGVLLLAAAGYAQADPLSYNSWAWVNGSIQTSYNSPLLGNVSFTLQGPSDYKSYWQDPSQLGSGLASVNYSIAAGQSSSDPVYNIVTNNGQYGFAYNGQAEAAGLKLRTLSSASTVNAQGTPEASPNSRLSTWSSAQWSQQFLIDSTPARPNGSYGAILVGFTLEGSISSDPNNFWQNGYSQGNGQLSSNFVDKSGVSFSSSFQIDASPWQQETWTGSKTVYKKLLFQYGTAFNINLYQYSSAYVNGTADFSHTGYISSIELPYQSTLQSGAEQAGLGGVNQLYGNVTHSSTADAINTNWDFNNNGGGFTPPVPEPSSYALMLAGLATLGFMSSRRRRGD